MGLKKSNKNEIDEILEEVIEIETHLHSNERWFEQAGTPSTPVREAGSRTGL